MKKLGLLLLVLIPLFVFSQGPIKTIKLTASEIYFTAVNGAASYPTINTSKNWMMVVDSVTGKAYVRRVSEVLSNVDTTGWGIAQKSWVTSYFQPTGSYEVTTNKQNSTSTSTTKYPTWYATKAYVDSVKTTVTSSQWTTEADGIYYNGKVGVGVANVSATDSLLQGTSASFTQGLKTGYDAVINGVTVGKGKGSKATNTAVGSEVLASIISGAGNTAIGWYSLNKNTNGTENTAIGVGALYTGTTHQQNVGIGYNALYSNMGDNNVGIGFTTMLTNTTGFSNTAIGVSALYSNTTASNLVAVGDSALYKNTGTFNTAVGSKSLYNNTSGQLNTALGYNALYSNNGSSNTAIGQSSLWSNTSGGNNVVVGANSLNDNTTGSNNTALGTLSLRFNTTGYSNVAVGISALKTNTTASNLVAVGDSALYSNTGARNVAVGSKALLNNTTGDDNTSVGINSLRTNSTATKNTAIGVDALYNNNGGSNTAVGYYSNRANTSGGGNTSLGYASLTANTTGVSNVAIGYSALSTNTTSNNNTAIGTQSLFSNTTGFSNVTAGVKALYGNITGSNNVAFGDSAGYQYSTLSNRLYLGSKADSVTKGIYGDLTTGKDWYRVNGTLVVKTLPVMTGTADSAIRPDYTHGGVLSIQKILAATIGDIPGLQDSLDRHTDTLQAHNTRINAIQDSLDRHTDTLQSHNTRINNVVTDVSSKRDTVDDNWMWSGGNTIQKGNIGNVGVGTTNPTAAKVQIQTQGVSTSSLLVRNNKGAGNDSVLTFIGNKVGIGTTAPAYNLSVNGTADISGTVLTQAVTPRSSSADFYIYTTGAKDIIFRSSTSSEKMRMLASGNFGIGTTAPQTKLHVTSSAVTDRWLFNLTSSQWNKNATDTTQATDTSSVSIRVSKGGNPLVKIKGKTGNDILANDTAGNWGMGTATPTEKLEVAGNIKTNIGTVDIKDTETVLDGGTSGTARWVMPFQGAHYKKVVIYLAALDGAISEITFPTAFDFAPHVYGDAAAVATATVTSTTCNITGATTSGWIFIEGY